VDNISIDHKLQLILYEWLWRNSKFFTDFGSRDFKLLNIKTGETLKLKNDQFKINQIIELLLSNKFVKKRVLLDHEFLNNVQKCAKKLEKK
jgi:hypothetical protein